jgi:hypothetical protein
VAEDRWATKGATDGTQVRVGLFKTNDWHENNKQNVTKNKTIQLYLIIGQCAPKFLDHLSPQSVHVQTAMS